MLIMYDWFRKRSRLLGFVFDAVLVNICPFECHINELVPLRFGSMLDSLQICDFDRFPAFRAFEGVPLSAAVFH